MPFLDEPIIVSLIPKGSTHSSFPSLSDKTKKRSYPINAIWLPWMFPVAISAD